jgi:hypothetical protein
MADWSPQEAAAVAAADELQITTTRRDGRPRTPVPVWVVADGDDLYLRSAYGTGSAWYRSALAGPHGHISAGGVDRDVAFTHVDDEAINGRLDAAYRSKYRRYGASYIDRMVAPQAGGATLKITCR